MADLEAMLRQMNNENNARTFQFNHDEGVLTRQFQHHMSNTAHTREVADLKNAGLNPVLSANSGAQSYSASSSSASADNSAVGALASIYQTKMSNENARQIATQQNNVALANKRTDLQIAKINAAASNYASNTAASASRYASDNARLASQYGTDNSKYGMLSNFLGGVTGSNSLRNTGSKVGKNIANSLANLFSGNGSTPYQSTLKNRSRGR